MQRKRRSGASDDGIAEVPVPCGFPRVRGIWFTVAFRETITIAAIGRAGRRVTRHWRIPRIESGLYGPAQECRPLSGTRTIARRASAAGDQIDNVGNLGRRAAHHRRRHKERGRRRTRQDQISIRALARKKLRTGRSAPNEENLFLLPDRLLKERTLSKLDPAV